MSPVLVTIVSGAAGAVFGYACARIADAVIEEGTGATPRASSPWFALGTAVLAATLAFAAGGEFASLRITAFIAMLAAIALADARAMLVPDTLSIGGAVLGLITSTLPGAPGLGPSLLGGGGALIGMLLIAMGGGWVFRREAMGGGDIKMLAMVGAFLGPAGAFVALFSGALFATVVALPFGPRGRIIPFGVFLAAGGALAAFFGRELLDGYGSLIMKLAG